jgi:adenylate kinase family enzyme
MGGSASGKTTVAGRLAETLAVPHVELDALNHDPGWQEAPVEVFRDRVLAACSGDGWVVDGNYRSKLGSLVLERADTVVFLDLAFWLVLRRGVRRTLVRTVTREELWNGNREQVRHMFSRYWIPWWIVQTHRHYAREIPQRIAAHPHLAVVHLRSPEEIEQWLQSIQATETTSGSSNGSDRQKTPPSVET